MYIYHRKSGSLKQAFIENLMLASGNELNIQQICMLLFENAAEGLVVTNTEGTMLLTNPRVLEMFGYTHDELIGKPVELLMPDSFRKRHTAHREHYTEHPGKRPMGIGLDLWAQRKDGVRFPIEISLNHFLVNGSMLVMALITDITERKKIDTQLHQLMQNLEEKVQERTHELEEAEQEIRKALQKEKQLNELKSRFVSIASHEFRTPLGTILSSASLIEKYLDIGDVQKTDKHVSRIKSAVGNLTAILNDFLSLEKLETGRVENRPVFFLLNDFLQEVVEEMQIIARKGQEIILENDSPPTMVYLDRQLLKNILNNLISNAIKYSPDHQKITVTFNTGKGKLAISVADEGIGIPASEHEQVFDRFFRAQNVSHIQGTGLGLNIVKKYIDLMGGHISFTTIENKGTTFTVSIPLNKKNEYEKDITY